MKAIVLDRLGAPTDVLRLAEVPIPSVQSASGAPRLLVKMEAASINPGDFLFVQGLYPDPKKPVFPAQIAGNHGVGRVVEAPTGSRVRPGTRVMFSYLDVWAEYVALPEEWAVPIPDDFSTPKASQLVNLVTAWDVLQATHAREGEWIAITAGNATVSTMISQMARARGVKVLSLVRRRLPALDLESFGSTAVVELGADANAAEGEIAARVAELTKGRGLRGVIDCVGGPLLGDLVRALTFAGKAIVYGGWRPERFALHNFDLLFKGASVEAYFYRYFFDPPKPEDAPMLERLIATTAPESFRVPRGEEHPIDDFARAIEESWLRPEGGKRFLRMG